MGWGSSSATPPLRYLVDDHWDREIRTLWTAFTFKHFYNQLTSGITIVGACDAERLAFVAIGKGLRAILRVDAAHHAGTFFIVSMRGKSQVARICCGTFHNFSPPCAGVLNGLRALICHFGKLIEFAFVHLTEKCVFHPETVGIEQEDARFETPTGFVTDNHYHPHAGLE